MAGDEPYPPVTVCADVDSAVLEVTVPGRWTRRLQVEATRAIDKCLAEAPRAVIVDLRGLVDPSAASAATWWTAAMHGAQRAPAVPVVLAIPPAAQLTGRLHRLGARNHLRMYASTADARTAVHRRLPLTARHQLRLPPQPRAAAAARDAVGAACVAWSMPTLVNPGRLVISELVDNAVTHAGTDITVTITHRGCGLHLAVCDGACALPRLLEPPASESPAQWDSPGLGLRTIDRIATIWGATPTASGKVVWAHLQP